MRGANRRCWERNQIGVGNELALSTLSEGAAPFLRQDELKRAPTCPYIGARRQRQLFVCRRVGNVGWLSGSVAVLEGLVGCFRL
jgi:hypothetical protein